jgi:hypothetical protein
MKIIKSFPKHINLDAIEDSIVEYIDEILSHHKDPKEGNFFLEEEDRKEIKHFLVLLSNRIQKRRIAIIR